MKSLNTKPLQLLQEVSKFHGEMGDRCHGEICGQVLLYDFAGHLVEDDDNEVENEIDFDTIDIIVEEDSTDGSG